MYRWLAAALFVLVVTGETAAAEEGRSYFEVARLSGAASTVGLAGPTVSRAAAVWGQRDRDGTVSVHRSGRAEASRTIYRAPTPKVPRDAARQGYDVAVGQHIAALASTSTHVALIRAAELSYRPRCRDQPTPCQAPSFVVPLFGELWAGPIGGRLRRLAGGPVSSVAQACTRWRPTSVDLAAGGVIYTEQLDTCRPPSAIPRRSRVVEAIAGRRAVVTTSEASALGPVAAAGSWAAWLRPGTASREGSVVVLRVLARTVAYRVGLPRAAVGEATFDVDARGRVAFAVPRGGACGAGEIAVASRAAPRLRGLGSWTETPVLRLDAARVVAVVERAPCARPAQLAALDFHGVLRPLVRFGSGETRSRSLAGSFDAQAGHFAFATTRSGSGRAGFATSIYVGKLPQLR
jgi:hypothetical protein